MVIEKLRTLTEAQYKRLHDSRVDVTRKTTVQEVLKFMRTCKAAVINDEAPMYCNIKTKGNYIAEVFWFGEKETGTVEWQNWRSNPVNDWEFAESLALDYMLGLEISIFDEKVI
jgi:UDP-N-acetylmuramyl pentapeptide synthase